MDTGNIISRQQTFCWCFKGKAVGYKDLTIEGPFIEYMGALIAPCEITCNVVSRVKAGMDCNSRSQVTDSDFLPASIMMTWKSLTRVSNHIVKQQLDGSPSCCQDQYNHRREGSITEVTIYSYILALESTSTNTLGSSPTFSLRSKPSENDAIILHNFRRIIR